MQRPDWKSQINYKNQRSPKEQQNSKYIELQCETRERMFSQWIAYHYFCCSSKANRQLPLVADISYFLNTDRKMLI